MMVILSVVLTYLCYGAYAAPNLPEPAYLEMLRATGQDAEFARLLKIDDVSLVRSNGERSMLNSNVSFLGDILLTREELEESRQTLKWWRFPERRWPNNVLPYWVSRDDYNQDERDRIESAIDTLNSKLKYLEIRPWRAGDNDYVWVFSGSGCWSYVGKIGGGQGLSIQKNGCLWDGTVMHEVLHAAGFGHMHTRPDRDNHVRILWNNIPDEWKSQYNLDNADDMDNNGIYDPYSIMHYGYYAPYTNNPAFEFYQNGVDTGRIGAGEKNGPTQLDINKANRLYQN